MTHWGWYWKVKNKEHIRKKLCSNLVQIDSFKIYKNGRTGEFQVKPLDILAKPMQKHLEITYRKQKSSPYKIPVDQVKCNYGGIKRYFRCPLCNNRMRILYLAENSIFICRKCLNLGYETQRYRTSNRYMMNESKILQGIKNLNGDLKSNIRPKGMHKKTFQKIKEKAYNYEAKWHHELNREILSWHGAKALPFLDGHLPSYNLNPPKN
jgi:hypothetical protein